MLKYRPDIDGLRGLAVLFVVLFHAGVAPLHGGFIGVDVFFVISGYLITSIVRDSLETGRFSFSQFYASRVRRLLPALLAMLLVTTIGCVFILLPDELLRYAKNLIESIFFTLNIFLWRDMGYFDLSADQRPLLHLWSLSVEEQFYLLWPPLLWAFWRNHLSRFVFLGASVIAIISLVGSQWAAINAPGAAFYLSPSRAWEPMFGAALALFGSTAGVPRIAREVLGVMGLALIVYATLTFDSTTSFPGLNALIPVLGTVLVILAGTDGISFASRALTVRPLVGVGLISYSLYLWHWPALSLARLYFNRPLTPAETIIALLASCIAAVISWRYIEVPFRKRFSQFRIPARAFAFGALSAALVSLVGVFLIGTHGLDKRIPATTEAAMERSQTLTPYEIRCHSTVRFGVPEADGCVFGASGAPNEYNAILWGDSHASALQPAVEVMAPARKLRFRQITKSGCPPLPGVDVHMIGRSIDLQGCEEFNRAAIGTIVKTPGIQFVIISARWSAYHFVGGNDAKVFRSLLAQTTKSMTDRGIRILIVGPTPELPLDISRCLARETLLHTSYPWCKEYDAGALGPDIAFIDNLISSVASENRLVRAVYPETSLCKGGRCRTKSADDFFYQDSNHLSIAGAKVLIPLLEAGTESSSAN